MPLILAVISSVMFGVADFFGGVAAKRASALTVVVGVQVIGLAGIAAAVPMFGGSPSPSGLAWGAGAGLCGSLGLVILYRALATTRMAVAAPVAAVVGALTPVLFGVAVGERPLPLAWAGVVLALPAVGMIGGGGRHLPGGDQARRGVELGVVIGILFGLFGILISRTGTETGMWPLLAARTASVTLMVVVAASLRRRLIPPGPVRSRVTAAGILDVVANVLFLLALRRELLSLVAVIMSLYPASTVALARVVLGERIARLQGLGMGLAVVAITLIMMA